MTEAELHQQKENFKTVVYWKGEITSRNNDIIRITRWDKNGSHTEAIKKAIGYRDDAKKILKEKLNGFEYEYVRDSLREATNMFKKSVSKNKNAKAYEVIFREFNPFKK